MSVSAFDINKQLPWTYDVQSMPCDKPVLVKIKSSTMPFMATRDEDFIDCHLETNYHTYGFARELSDVECWLDVTDFVSG